MEQCKCPRGDKSKYTDKQKRKAEHIADSYEDRGTSAKEAKRRAYATVNKESGGGNKSGSGRGKKDTNVSSKRGGKSGGAASAKRPAAARSAAAKKAAATRKRNAAKKKASCGRRDDSDRKGRKMAKLTRKQRDKLPALTRSLLPMGVE